MGKCDNTCCPGSDRRTTSNRHKEPMKTKPTVADIILTLVKKLTMAQPKRVIAMAHPKTFTCFTVVILIVYPFIEYIYRSTSPLTISMLLTYLKYARSAIIADPTAAKTAILPQSAARDSCVPSILPRIQAIPS